MKSNFLFPPQAKSHLVYFHESKTVTFTSDGQTPNTVETIDLHYELTETVEIFDEEIEPTHFVLPPKNSRIIVVSLDLHRNARSTFPRFCSAVAKLKLLLSRVEYFCQKLCKDEPYGMWIMVWRENGITDYGKSYISSETKTLLKKRIHPVNPKIPAARCHRWFKFIKIV